MSEMVVPSVLLLCTLPWRVCPGAERGRVKVEDVAVVMLWVGWMVGREGLLLELSGRDGEDGPCVRAGWMENMSRLSAASVLAVVSMLDSDVWVSSLVEGCAPSTLS